MSEATDELLTKAEWLCDTLMVEFENYIENEGNYEFTRIDEGIHALIEFANEISAIFGDAE